MRVNVNDNAIHPSDLSKVFSFLLINVYFFMYKSRYRIFCFISLIMLINSYIFFA